MKLRLRWVLSCEKRAGRSEMADWRKAFAVPEGVGATKIKATCRSARGAFGASWRKLEEATLALGRVQNFASHLAWQWHTAMEGAREASMLGSSLWGHLPGTIDSMFKMCTPLYSSPVARLLLLVTMRLSGLSDRTLGGRTGRAATALASILQIARSTAAR